MWAALRQTNTHKVDATTWLEHQGVRGQLSSSLGPVLDQLYGQGWDVGERAGMAVSGGTSPGPQVKQDQIKASKHQWLDQIVDTLLSSLAVALLAGGTVAVLGAALKAVLAGAANALRIAQTEITRIIALAAMAVYRKHRIKMARWITEHDAKVCRLCEANEAAGPVALGHPFPSGAYAAPQHPRCRCAVVPA